MRGRRLVAPGLLWYEMSEVPQLALDSGLTACDAAYLSLAQSLRAPLATFDRRLGDVATQATGTAGGLDLRRALDLPDRKEHRPVSGARGGSAADCVEGDKAELFVERHAIGQSSHEYPQAAHPAPLLQRRPQHHVPHKGAPEPQALVAEVDRQASQANNRQRTLCPCRRPLLQPQTAGGRVTFPQLALRLPDRVLPQPCKSGNAAP